MSKVKEILQLFEDKPYTIRQGAGYISKRFRYPIEDVKQARREYHRNRLNQHSDIPQKLPKILVLDIETAPLRAYVWSRWKQNVYLDQTISEWFMLTWAAKWLDEDIIYSNKLTSEEAIKEDDKRIVEELWILMDDADIVIAHNGKQFDIPKMNTRFIINQLPPPTPYKQIDTKEVAARQFGFSSNKLDALAGYFNIRHKDDTDFNLWDMCMKGDEKSLEYMETYNKGDVVILEQVYYKLRPWIKNHPNISLYMDINKPTCPYCGSTDVTSEDKDYAYTPTSKYALVRCNNCKGLSRMSENLIPKDKRKQMLKST